MRLPRCVAALAVLSLFSAPAAFGDDPEETPDLTIRKGSYALGVSLGKDLKDSPVDLDLKAVAEGLLDVAGGKDKLTDEQIQEAVGALQQMAREQAMAEQKAAMDKVKADSAAFLAKHKEEPGVKVTDTGLQYLVIKEGEGKKPAATDTVKVHYHGTLPDGTVFDSSVDRGQPATFPLNRVIAGWTEGVQLMSVGSKYKFVIPSELAYGERGSPPKIMPGQALVFEVELLDIVQQ